MSWWVAQSLQMFGALLILAAFAAAQAGKLPVSSRTYLALNFVGSGILAALAYLEGQWGFVVLETVWAGISLVALLRSKAVAPQ